jgi:glycosyltransferase involved in cell wall biosynthesis
VSSYIAETIKSVLNQSFDAFEIIVIDDGSSDSADLQRRLEPFERRIRYQRTSNRGPSSARNCGIRLSQGEYIAFLDGDDCWEPSYLEWAVGKASAESLDLVYCDSRLFGTLADPGETFMQKNPCAGPCSLEALIRPSCVICTSTTLVRRDAVVSAGMFDESIFRSEDFDLWIRMAARGMRLGYETCVLGWRRMHRNNVSQDASALIRGGLMGLSKLMSDPALTDEIRQLIHRRAEELESEATLDEAKAALASRRYRDARQRFQKYRQHRDSIKLRAVVAGLAVCPQLVRHFTQSLEKDRQDHLREFSRHDIRAFLESDLRPAISAEPLPADARV